MDPDEFDAIEQAWCWDEANQPGVVVIPKSPEVEVDG